MNNENKKTCPRIIISLKARASLVARMHDNKRTIDSQITCIACKKTTAWLETR